MKLRLFIIGMALVALGTGIHAQEKTQRLNPWFVEGQLGASYAVGNTGFGQLISPAGAISVGKYFSPVWGARLSISGWRGRYGSEVSSQAHGFYFGAATVDGLMNLSQLIRKYPERPVDVDIIAGVGFNRTFSHSVSSFMARLGLRGSIRLNDAFDFNVEALANGVSDRWNRLDDHSFDTYINLMVGLSYRFGTGFKCPTCLSKEAPSAAVARIINEKVNEQRAEMVVKTDTIIIEKEVAAPSVTKVVKGLKSHVAFGLSQTSVAGEQEMNVLAVADYMKQFPDSKATVTGYADKGTGSREINLRLAKQRAETVADLLTHKYGIDSSRLTVSGMEGEEQPFNTNDWNRVVIITAD